ncbi:MAG: restriction endonuclease subunit S [Patescibacteria group bacterium]|nr:restriction endonuclease subunit S [Patescibacteria group bacterium]
MKSLSMSSKTLLNLGKATSKIGSGATPRGGKAAYLGGETSLIRSLNVYDHGFQIEGLAKINAQQAESLKNVTVIEDDVLFNITGASVARCCVVPKEILPARVNQHVSIIRTDKSVLNPHYLHYYLIHPDVKSKLLSASGGSSREAITKDQLEGLSFEAADIRTQNAVAQILTKLDDKIALNNKLNAELEKVARLTFDYWFLQFDFPDANNKPYRSSGGSMIYSPELKTQLPEAWQPSSIQELVYKAKNGDWGNSDQGGDSIKAHCIRGADIDGLNGVTAFDPPLRYIKRKNGNRLLKENDLIVEISGGSPVQSTGRMAHISEYVIDRLEGSVVCSNFCKAISLKNPRLSFVVNHYWMRLYESGVFFNHEGKTSGIKNLMFDQLIKDVYIALPKDNQLIEKFYKFSSSIDQQKQLHLTQNLELERLRDLLLPLLMTGQVKVN